MNSNDGASRQIEEPESAAAAAPTVPSSSECASNNPTVEEAEPEGIERQPIITRTDRDDELLAMAREKEHYKLSHDLIDQYVVVNDNAVDLNQQRMDTILNQSQTDEKYTSKPSLHMFEGQDKVFDILPKKESIYTLSLSKFDEEDIENRMEARPGAVSVSGPAILFSKHDKADEFLDEMFTAKVAIETDCEKKKDEKGAGACGNGRRVPRPRATAPGVEFVRQRAPGMRPSWYLERMRRHPQGSAQDDHHQARQEEEEGPPTLAESQWTTMKKEVMKLPQRKKWYLVLGAILLCAVIGLGVGLGVKAVNSKNHDLPADSTTKFDAFTQDCNVVQTQVHPHVLSQCHCDGKVSKVASDIEARYNTLLKTATFLLQVDPNFHNKTSMESCILENQALLWLASGDGAPDTPTISQRYSAALLFILWNGPSWTRQIGWLTSSNECDWSGINCNSDKGITDIALNNNNLQGGFNLNGSTVLFPSLTSLDLSDNQLQGSIVSNLGMFSLLTKLMVNNNQLNGTVPTEFGLLPAIEDLRLAHNTISGPLPSELGLLSSLLRIDLSYNRITGQLPSEIGLWRTNVIHFDYNNFTSTIPSEIGLISSLQHLILNGAGLYGTIPSEIFRLGGLTHFIVGANALNGTIPKYIGQALNLEFWSSAANNITGTIPSEFGLCTNLMSLDVSSNQLTGTLPSELGSLSHLVQLVVDGNKLTGAVPEQVCQVTAPVSCITSLHCWACACSCNGFSFGTGHGRS